MDETSNTIWKYYTQGRKLRKTLEELKITGKKMLEAMQMYFQANNGQTVNSK